MSLMANCFTILNGNTAEGSASALLPGQWDSYRQWEKFIMPEMASTVLQGAANPPGHYLGNVFQPPIKVGEMSMRTDSVGRLSANLYPTLAMSVNLTGSSSFSATAGLVIAMAMAMSGSGSMTAAIEGRLNMLCNLSGNSSMSAGLSGIASMAIDMLGAGDLEATIAAYGNMEIDIVVTGTGLSTANVGQAVWAALASANDAAGSMGEKLNDAGSASNPWTEVIESGYTAAEILRLLAAIAQGDASGLENGNPVFKSIDGTKDRVTATYTAGTRVVGSRDVT
jgi:hypothetical protein